MNFLIQPPLKQFLFVDTMSSVDKNNIRIFSDGESIGVCTLGLTFVMRYAPLKAFQKMEKGEHKNDRKFKDYPIKVKGEVKNQEFIHKY